MIRLDAVHRTYALGSVPVYALRGIELEIRAGEYLSVMGPSGSGKSTLLNLLGALDRPDQGEVWIGGERLGGASADALAELRSRRIGFVFQLFHLIPRIDACRNVELPMIYAGVPRAERRRRALELLDRVGLARRADHAPRELSGGEQQRVAISRALVNDPDVIVADEPTGNLDSESSEQVLQIFDELHGSGKTIVVVTHNPEVALRAERRITLRDGLIESEARR